MAKKLRVGVLFGGRSGEHEVSLVSAHSVLNTLNPQKYQITQIGITLEGDWLVGENVLQALTEKRTQELTPAVMLPIPSRPDIYTITETNQGEALSLFAELDLVFPVLHGSYGEDGTLQGLLEMTDIPYVGAGVLGSSVGMDKALFKDVMVANQISIVPSLLVLHSEMEDLNYTLQRIDQAFEYPLFVKPANMGSSVGVNKCKDIEELALGLKDAAQYDRRILVEKGINAREIELSVLGNQNPRVSVPGEIRPSAEFYSYQAKYHDDSSELIIPADLTADQVRQFQDYALKAYIAIDCAGMARVDFLMDKETGEIYLNEVNTIPGFTPISMYPKLWEASGLSYEELIDELISLALERKREKDQLIRKYDFQAEK
jgi:D-alanine-D-alanine ligase